MSDTTAITKPGVDTTIRRQVSTTRREWWSLRLMLIFLFVQVWHDVGGFTVRTDDLIALLVVTAWLLTAFRSGVFRYYRSRLNLPLIGWMGVIALGIGVTMMRPFSTEVKQDSLVNGFRLLLALALFFAVYNHPLSPGRKSHIIFSTIIGFSLVTTFVSLLQIGYWDGWLPISLPSVLTTLKAGADDERGREIFALFVGNTGTHTWTGMLAMQAIAVWIVANSLRKWPYRLAGLAYFLVLVLVLVRTSVRTSILGLGIAIFTIIFIQGLRSRFPFNRVAKPILLVGGVLAGIALLLSLAPDIYFVQRIIQTIPQVSSEGIIINRASNIFGRIDYAANALRIYREFPLTGGGFGSYQTLSGTIGTISVVHAHNSYAQTLAELGTLGGIALLWLMWAIFRTLRDSPPRGAAPGKVQLWYFNVAAMVFLGFAAFFINAFWEPNQVALRMILLGALAHVQRDTWE